MKYAVVAVMGDRTMDAFMHATDLFDAHKALGQVVIIDVEREDKGPLDVAAMLASIRPGLEEEARVSAFFCAGHAEGAWRDPQVTQISNGNTWGMLDDILAASGWVGEAEGVLT